MITHRFAAVAGQSTRRPRSGGNDSDGGRERRNVVGAHAGAYALYRALAIAAGNFDPWR